MLAFTTDFSVCMLLSMTVNPYHVLDRFLFSIDKSVGVWQDGNTSFYYLIELISGDHSGDVLVYLIY